MINLLLGAICIIVPVVAVVLLLVMVDAEIEDGVNADA